MKYLKYLLVLCCLFGCIVNKNVNSTQHKKLPKDIKFNLKINIDVLDDNKIKGFKSSKDLSVYFKDRLVHFLKLQKIPLSSGEDASSVDIYVGMKYRRDIFIDIVNITSMANKEKTKPHIYGQFYRLDIKFENENQNLKNIHIENEMLGKKYFNNTKYEGDFQKFTERYDAQMNFKRDISVIRHLLFYQKINNISANKNNFIRKKSLNYKLLTNKLIKLLEKFHILGMTSFDDYYELKYFDEIAKEVAKSIKNAKKTLYY